MLVCTLLFFQCTFPKGPEIKNISIKIEPFDGSTKFWNICLDPRFIGDNSVVYFKIHTKNSRVKEYQIEAIHLRDSCDRENINLHFGDRETPMAERDWFKNLNAEDIDSILVRIKHYETDTVFIFNKILYSSQLK